VRGGHFSRGHPVAGAVQQAQALKHGVDGPTRFTATKAGNLTRLWQFGQGIVQWYKAGSIIGVADHAIKKYARKLDEIGAKRTQTS
jgi:hypothetical protein